MGGLDLDVALPHGPLRYRDEEPPSGGEGDCPPRGAPVVEVDERTPEQDALIAMLREVSKVFGTQDIIEEYVA